MPWKRSATLNTSRYALHLIVINCQPTIWIKAWCKFIYFINVWQNSKGYKNAILLRLLIFGDDKRTFLCQLPDQRNIFMVYYYSMIRAISWLLLIIFIHRKIYGFSRCCSVCKMKLDLIFLHCFIKFRLETGSNFSVSESETWEFWICSKSNNHLLLTGTCY